MNAFRSIHRSRGAIAFGSLTALTMAATFGAPLFRGGAFPPAPPPPPPVVQPLPVPGIPGQVNLVARLSQTKVAQGRDGRVFVELGIETPAGTAPSVANEKPTDMILVLDRSGSMADARKMDYAKSAIRALVDRMNDRDRLALVSFDDSARTDVELTQMNAAGRARVRSVVDSIYPGSSTNISAGFDTAGVIVAAGGPAAEARSVRVLLLSDGEANSGVMTQEGLAGIAAGLARKSAVVSTIGLGIGYNQNVLAAISDHGMGTYNYLESLEGLGRILEADLRQSRALYASASEVQFRLGEGVRLESAGDYPFQQEADGTVRVQTGQLLGGSRKAVTLTLAVPTDRVREIGLGELAFGYDHEGKRMSGHVAGDPLRVSVVERESDAYASLSKDVYYKGWYASNVGNAKKAFANALAKGDRAAADQAVAELQKAGAVAPAAAGFGSGEGAGVMAQLKEAASELLADESYAFSGDAAAAASKQNQIAKKQHAGARALQRQE